MRLIEGQPIVQRCAELFLVAPRDLTGRYRFDFVMRARFALYLALRLQGRSYPNIGKIVDRDHSTIMNGVKRAEWYFGFCIQGDGIVTYQSGVIMPTDLFAWGSRVERERHNRIKLSVLAYAYEIAGDPLASDAEFDALALTSDPTIQTGKHDRWWANAFQPYTGSWIHNHPDLAGVVRCYNARKAARSSAVRPAMDG